MTLLVVDVDLRVIERGLEGGLLLDLVAAHRSTLGGGLFTYTSLERGDRPAVRARVCRVAEHIRAGKSTVAPPLGDILLHLK